jgi:hypothetical protein
MRLSVLRAGRILPLGRFLVLIRNIHYKVRVDKKFISKQNSLKNGPALTVQLFNLAIKYAIKQA